MLDPRSPALYLALVFGLGLGCAPTGDDDDAVSADDDDAVGDDDDAVGDDDDDTGATTEAWYFTTDTTNNTWNVLVFATDDPTDVITTFAIDDLSALSAPEADGGNGKGAAWGDAVLSTDGNRIFVNARNADRLAVFETATRSLEALLETGGRPVHLYNPNHGDEIWTHSDGPGYFQVIDQATLQVSDPVVAALNDAGHGKLLYAEEMGTKYFATNTNDPGVFPIDGDARTVGDLIPVCAVPCEDDPETTEDESLDTCGSTHDKAYNPTMDWAIFQCSGAARGSYGIVDATTNEIISAAFETGGSIAHTPAYEYTIVISGDDVQIWDTAAQDHDGIAFDAVVTLEGKPSARGSMFWQNAAGEWEAWIPQTEGTELSILNLATLEVETVEIGVLTEPDGASHFSRRGGIGGGSFFTYNDAGAVVIDLETRTVTAGAPTPGMTGRIAVVHGP